ncbi:hypothetical protein IV38_GL001678 [Lactobacillus selangorensis]|uniref:Uncharacterized protein n=1 Tax=Lactobacillus selangorensis TaxID=81857 RepID=A0A0R2G1T0_9LACO|nr:hypothetical protein [Lactobacillus selangorensis]KRN28224.1 hypothetical protein IV38_GL001678 [Lactobacillus selangorensis]KRN30900.1 hypothetical protein IV40_GL001537 [Lactobacillus selangorensis]
MKKASQLFTTVLKDIFASLPLSFWILNYIVAGGLSLLVLVIFVGNFNNGHPFVMNLLTILLFLISAFFTPVVWGVIRIHRILNHKSTLSLRNDLHIYNRLKQDAINKREVARFYDVIRAGNTYHEVAYQDKVVGHDVAAETRAGIKGFGIYLKYFLFLCLYSGIWVFGYIVGPVTMLLLMSKYQNASRD